MRHVERHSLRAFDAIERPVTWTAAVAIGVIFLVLAFHIVASFLQAAN